MRARQLVLIPLLLLACSREGPQIRKLQMFRTLYLPLQAASLKDLGGSVAEGRPVVASDLAPGPVYREVTRKGQSLHARVLYTVQGAVPKGTIYQPMTRAQALTIALADPEAQAVVFDPDYTVSWVLPKDEIPAVIAAYPGEKPLPFELYVRR